MAGDSAQDLWQRKSDDELIAAFRRLGDYTDEGSAVITAEMSRRQLPRPEDAPNPAPIDLVASIDAVETTNPIVSLWRGNYPLAVTYWGWAVVGGLLLRAFANFLIQTAPPGGVGSAFIAIVVLATIAYQILVGVGVWRSANRYTGWKTWAVLAQAGVAAGVTLVCMRYFMVLVGAS